MFRNNFKKSSEFLSNKDVLPQSTRIDEPVGLIHASMEFIFEPSGSSIKFLLLVPWIPLVRHKTTLKTKGRGIAKEMNLQFLLFLLVFFLWYMEFRVL